jgi:hypothetical protein
MDAVTISMGAINMDKTSLIANCHIVLFTEIIICILSLCYFFSFLLSILCLVYCLLHSFRVDVSMDDDM